MLCASLFCCCWVLDVLVDAGAASNRIGDGFRLAGVAPAAPVPSELSRLRGWPPGALSDFCKKSKYTHIVQKCTSYIDDFCDKNNVDHYPTRLHVKYLERMTNYSYQEQHVWPSVLWRLDIVLTWHFASGKRPPSLPH